MMDRPVILFIHGGGKGACKEDRKLSLFLEEALKDQYIVKYPRMPDESNPDYKNYKMKIEEELEKINGSLVMMGHSVGSCFLLKYLSEEKVDKDMVGIFLTATPFWGEGGWQYEGFRLENDFPSKLPAKVPVFFYHSTDDEIVPFSHLALYAQKMPHANFRRIAERGHQFNNDLSEVVEDIKSLGIKIS